MFSENDVSAVMPLLYIMCDNMVPYLTDMAKLPPLEGAGETHDDGDAHWKVRINLLKESRGFNEN